MDTVKWFKARAKNMLKMYRDGDKKTISLVRQYTHNRTRIRIRKIRNVVAKDAGFVNWEDLIQASEEQQVAAAKRLES